MIIDYSILILIGILGTISIVGSKWWWQYRLKAEKQQISTQGKTRDDELKNWIMTAIENPNIAIDAVEKEIQELEVAGEKGLPLQIAMLKKQALIAAAKNPELARSIAPRAIEMGFKLYKRVKAMAGGLI